MKICSKCNSKNITLDGGTAEGFFLICDDCNHKEKLSDSYIELMAKQEFDKFLSLVEGVHYNKKTLEKLNDNGFSGYVYYEGLSGGGYQTQNPHDNHDELTIEYLSLFGGFIHIQVRKENNISYKLREY